MARWRAAAIENLPEFRELIAKSPNVMSLWLELRRPFEEAYRRQPLDESVIRRIYAYATWCMAARNSPDASRDPATAVAVAFYEHIPTFPAARDDMPRWFSYQEIAQSKGIFAYHIGDTSYEALLEHMRRSTASRPMSR